MQAGNRLREGKEHAHYWYAAKPSLLEPKLRGPSPCSPLLCAVPVSICELPPLPVCSHLSPVTARTPCTLAGVTWQCAGGHHCQPQPSHSGGSKGLGPGCWALPWPLDPTHSQQPWRLGGTFPEQGCQQTRISILTHQPSAPASCLLELSICQVPGPEQVPRK